MVTKTPSGPDAGGENAAGRVEGICYGLETLGGGTDVCVDGTEQTVEQGLRKNDVVE